LISLSQRVRLPCWRTCQQQQRLHYKTSIVIVTARKKGCCSIMSSKHVDVVATLIMTKAFTNRCVTVIVMCALV
jgi:hypothetical protein